GHDQNVTVRGDITATRVAGRGGKMRFEAVLMDETGRLDLVWFNMPYLQHKIYPGLRVRIRGKTKRRGPGLQVANANIEILKEGLDEPSAEGMRIRPVYPASEAITSAQIERLIDKLLEPALAQVEDHL